MIAVNEPRNSPPALQAVGLSKSFGSTRALRSADISIRRGEVLALLGENGSGKSTLAKVLCGAHQADGGRIEIGGKICAINDPSTARSLGVGIVFQELSLAPDLSVVDNLFLGREITGAIPGCLSIRRQRRACQEALAEVGLQVNPDQRVRELSMAQKQLLEVAKALLQKPAVLIFDEPTARLSEKEVDHLFEAIERMRLSGAAILYVTHHMREVLRICDRVSVMRDGEVVAEAPVSEETTEENLVLLLTAGKRSQPQPAVKRAAKKSLLEICNLRTRNCSCVSITIAEGEIVGIYGVMGCGRDEAARALVGLHALRGGEIRLCGAPYKASGPRDALNRGVGFLAGDRKEGGILPNRSIRENLTLAALSNLSAVKFVNLRKERVEALRSLENLRVKHDGTELPITALSGGNQQKVLLGRALLAQPRLLVLEDPTAGVDVGAKEELYDLVRAAADAGMGFLWLSSDVTETLSVCDKIYAMYQGRIVGELRNPGLDDEDILLGYVLGRDGGQAEA